jgi:hypothetical protein
VIELRNIDPSRVYEGAALPTLEIDVTRMTFATALVGTHEVSRVHHDTEYAKGRGVRDVFLNTMWYQATLGRYVTDWAGNESFLRVFDLHMNRPNCPYDHLTVNGVVTSVFEKAGRSLADVSVTVDNQIDKGSVTAQITVEFPWESR